MKEQFILLDEALIDGLFQPLADRITERWTFGPFRLARIFLDAAAVALILSQLDHIPGTAAFRDSLPYFYPLLVLVPGLGGMSILRNEFRRTEMRGGTHKSAAANPLRANMHLHRALCVCWVMVLMVQTSATSSRLEGVALLAVGLFTTMAVYFAACFARPAKPRAARNWGQLYKGAVLFARRTIR
jgi:hypothetical protein